MLDSVDECLEFSLGVHRNTISSGVMAEIGDAVSSSTGKVPKLSSKSSFLAFLISDNYAN